MNRLQTRHGISVGRVRVVKDAGFQQRQVDVSVAGVLVRSGEETGSGVAGDLVNLDRLTSGRVEPEPEVDGLHLRKPRPLLEIIDFGMIEPNAPVLCDDEAT